MKKTFVVTTIENNQRIEYEYDTLKQAKQHFENLSHGNLIIYKNYEWHQEYCK